MRNKYPGECYRCNKQVPPNGGYFQRYKNTWKLQHDTCCHLYRDIGDYIQRRAALGDDEAKQLDERLSGNA